MVLRAREADPPDRAENARETVRGPKTRVGGDAENAFRRGPSDACLRKRVLPHPIYIIRN